MTMRKTKGNQKIKRHHQRKVRNVLIHRPMQREFTLIMISLLMISTLAVGFVIHETIREMAFGGGFRFYRGKRRRHLSPGVWRPAAIADSGRMVSRFVTVGALVHFGGSVFVGDPGSFDFIRPMSFGNPSTIPRLP